MQFPVFSHLPRSLVLFLVLSLSGLFVPSLLAQVVTTYTWSGADPLVDFWNDADNWENGTTPPTVHNTLRLEFGAADSYASENTYSDIQVYQLVFTQDAGQYTISGDRIRPYSSFGGMYIENNSQHMQIIETDLLQTFGAITIRSGRSGILWSGRIATTTGNRTMVKDGKGDLILQGDHSLDAGTSVVTWAIGNGTLILDMANGGMLKAGTNITFNNAPSAGGTFRVIGKQDETTLTLGSLTLGNIRGMTRIHVDSNGGDGTHLVFSSLANFTGGLPSLNFDLTSPDTSVQIASRPAYTYANLYHWATVTNLVTVGEDTVRKTGFAAFDANDYVYRVDSDAFALLPASGAVQNTGYRTSGELTLTANVSRIDLLVIQGGGELKQSAPGLRLGTHGSILMEEGVSDYIISVSHLMHTSSSSMRIFQYSEVGDLIIRSSFGGTSFYYNARLSTAGPGKIIIESSNPHFRGDAAALNIQEGHLQLDGSFESAFQVNVMGGTLSGRGTIGGGTNWADPNIADGTRYTPVHVYDTLDASNHTYKALTIIGSLTLYDQATYQMTLGDNRQTALSVTRDPVLTPESVVVTLLGDLSLDLTFAPTLNEWIVLLTTNGAISGQFLTINGQSFYGLNGDEFSLLYNSQDYGFRIAYDHDLGGGITAVAIQVQAIPEPATVAVLAGLVLAGLVYLRRRSRP